MSAQDTVALLRARDVDLPVADWRKRAEHCEPEHAGQASSELRPDRVLHLSRCRTRRVEPEIGDCLVVLTQRVTERGRLLVEPRNVVRPVLLRRYTEHDHRLHRATQCGALIS